VGLSAARCEYMFLGFAYAASGKEGGKLMGWMAPASTGVAMRHSAGVKICL